MTVQYQAMTTTTGASAVLANGAFLTALKALIVAESAWSLVEDNSSVGSTPYRYVCFKNDHTISGAPADFYVLFTLATVSGTTSSVFVGEAYNSGTHVLSGCCPIDSSSAFAISASGLLASSPTVTPAANGSPTLTGTVSPFQGFVGGNGTTIFWQAVVYDDHLFVAANNVNAAGTAASGYYIGSYNSLVPTPATNDPVRILFLQMQGTTITGFSREPLQLASTTRTHPCSAQPAITQSPEYVRATSISATYDYIQGNYPVSRYVVMSNSTLSGGTTGMSARGILNDTIMASSTPASLTVGDTVTYNGHSWAAVGSASLGTTAWIFVDTGS